MTTTLQSTLADPATVLEKITAGLPWGEAEALAEWLELPIARLGRFLDIAPATMSRRKHGRFDEQESDRVLRLARLWFLACDAVGGAAGARSWLKRRQYGLNGAVPLELVRFEAGAREVEALLRRILYGVLA